MPVNTQELINEIQSWISEPVTEPDRFEKEELHEMVEKSDEYLKELLKQVQSLQSQLSKCKRERDGLRGKYSELIMQVASKLPYESRHETALRYIRQAENHDNGPEATLSSEVKDDY